MTFKIFSSNPNKNLFYNKTPHQIMQQRCPQCTVHNMDDVKAARDLGDKIIAEADGAREYTRMAPNLESVPNNAYYFYLSPRAFDYSEEDKPELYYFVPTEDKYSDECEISIKTVKPKEQAHFELAYPNIINPKKKEDEVPFKGLEAQNTVNQNIVSEIKDDKTSNAENYNDIEDEIVLNIEDAEDFDDDDYDEIELRAEDAEDLTFDDYIDNDIELSKDAAVDFDDDEEIWEYMVFADESAFDEDDMKDSCATNPTIMELNNIIQNRKYTTI